MSETVLVTDVVGAVDALELVTVEFYGVEARRNEDYEPTEGFEPTDEPGGDLAIRTAYRERDGGLDFRVSITLEEPWARIEADGAVIYSAAEGTQFAPEAVKEFGEMVAAMTIFPYLREAVASISDRIGFRLTLPMVNRGVIEFAVSDEVTPQDDPPEG